MAGHTSGGYNVVLPAVNTDPVEFLKFHEILMAGAPEGYEPYYFPLEKNGKDPLPAISWKKNRKTFSEAYNLMEQGFNIGIAGTDKDNLCIVDVDNLEAVGETKATLTVKSRKQIGRHCFYFTSDPVAKSIFENSSKQNIATEDAGEVRANWQYVVAAGSFVPCTEEEIDRISVEDRAYAGKYRLYLESDVSNITFNELPEVYIKVIEEKRERAILAQLKPKIKQFSQYQDKDSKYKSALWNLDIHDVTGKPNNPNHRFPSPFHGSKTFKDTSVSGDLLHCWRHNVSHNAITYLAVESGVSTCSRAGFPHGGGNSDVDKEDPETVFTIWKYAKDRGCVPKDDPIPSAAMRYYAKKNGIHDCNNLEDGWKLPTEAYNKVLEECEKEGIETDRKQLTGRKGKKKSGEDQPEKVTVPFDVVAEHILKNNHIFTMRDNKQIYVYANGVYRSEGTEAILDTEIRNVHNEYYAKYWNITNPDFPLTHILKATTKYVSEALAYIRAYTHIPRESIEEYENKYINFKNRLLNLETWEFEDHKPEIKTICQIPVNYNPEAECPQITKFLKDVAQPEDIDFLEEWVGYCLTTDVSYQKALMLYGIPGTGKSVFALLLETFIGKENASAESLQKLEEDKYRPAKLYGKRVNVCSDIPSAKLHKNEMFKKLVSGLDTIDAENKYQDPFKFRNKSKLTFSANKLPEGPKDQAFYERFCLIEFGNKFRGTEKDDKNLIRKLTEETEMSGFLNVALKGLKRLYDSKKFSYNKTFEETERVYLLNSNPVNVFMEECTQYAEEDIESTMLYLSYAGWSQEHKQERVSKIEFSRKLSKMGYTNHRENEIDKITGKINCSKKVTLWDNIKLKPADKNTTHDEKEQLGQDQGQDQINRSCPKKSSHMMSKNSLKIDIGQDLKSYVDPSENNIYYQCDNIETVVSAKSDKMENPANNKETSCPKSRFFDSGSIGQDDINIKVSDHVLEQIKLISDQSEEEDSINNYSTCELMRTDLKNYARSKYNYIVDNVPVFVGEFNKEFPGYKQKYGLDAVLSNAERLSSRGWK